MRIEQDGFKHPEKLKDSTQDASFAIYENTVLLHEQIAMLRKEVEELKEFKEMILRMRID